jgi:MarR family transcriptional regulator, lower aerobic nicotinate degradation pathway regulator
MSTLRRVSGRPTWLLGRANARAHRLLTDAFSEHGVRGYHFRLLAALEEHGPSSQADLGRTTGIDRSDVVATLDELVERGMARRAPDPQDGRRNIVTVTPRGARTLESLDLVLDRVQEDFLAPLSARERTTLVGLLEKLG